jgi:hypothetical protein
MDENLSLLTLDIDRRLLGSIFWLQHSKTGRSSLHPNVQILRCVHNASNLRHTLRGRSWDTKGATPISCHPVYVSTLEHGDDVFTGAMIQTTINSVVRLWPTAYDIHVTYCTSQSSSKPASPSIWKSRGGIPRVRRYHPTCTVMTPYGNNPTGWTSANFFRICPHLIIEGNLIFDLLRKFYRYQSS